MTDFLSDNAMYVVLLIVLVIWFGLAWYLRRLDNRITEAEKKIAGMPRRSVALEEKLP